MKLLKIGIIIISIITITAIIFGLTQQDVTQDVTQDVINKEMEMKPPTSLGIDSAYDEIEKGKIKNEGSQKPFIPKDRDWPTSGPFMIDRSEYILGEKIFVNVDQLSTNDKGKIKALRPINSTHHQLYHVMPFDGSGERNNYYFTPDLSELRGICSTDEIVGDWLMIFEGTDYPDIKFKVTKGIIPGYEERYETIVNKGSC